VLGSNNNIHGWNIHKLATRLLALFVIILGHTDQGDIGEITKAKRSDVTNVKVKSSF